MEKFPAGQIVRSNRTFPIHVTDYGRWGSDNLPGGYTAGSRDELEKKIIQYVKETAVKVAVPFVQLHQTHSGRMTVRHGTATGIHGNTGNVLVQWADGKREQVRSFGTPGVSTLRGLPADKIHEWVELTKRAADAVRSLREFEKNYEIDMKTEIKSRQQVAVDEADETSQIVNHASPDGCTMKVSVRRKELIMNLNSAVVWGILLGVLLIALKVYGVITG